MKRYSVHVCGRCGAQQWFAGSCPEPGCYGRVKTFAAVRVDEMSAHVEEVAGDSSPVPAFFIRDFWETVVSILKR